MKTCKHEWCEEEIHLPLGDTVALTHRAVIETVIIAGDAVSVTLGAVDDGPPYVLIEATEEGSSAATVITSTSGSEACKLAAGLVNAVDRASLLADEDESGNRLMWDVDNMRTSMRERADAERHEHGPELRIGPFDDAPLGLAAITSMNFTEPCNTKSVADYLLSTLTARDVETGHVDREIAMEVATVLGPDATQIIAGWIARSGNSDS